MVWKTVPDGDTGTGSKFGGDDTNKISDLFNGVDVDDVTLVADTIVSKLKSESYIDLKAIAEPASPASGYIRYYIDSTNGKFSAKHSDGSVTVFE